MAWAQYQTDFYNKVWASVQDVARRIGVSAEVIFAQLALESNWGRSELTRTGNNFAGIKAVGDQPYIVRRTREVINGVSQYVNARFRSYSTVQEGIEGYGRFITENPRYRAFIAVPSGNIDSELAALQASGYATDPEYSSKLRRVINNLPFQNSGTSGAPNTDSINGIIGGVITPFNPLLGGVFSNFGTDIAEGANTVVETVTGPFDWIKETFTIGNGTRLISIILGIALVIVAIIVLANSSDSLKLEAPVPA